MPIQHMRAGDLKHDDMCFVCLPETKRRIRSGATVFPQNRWPSDQLGPRCLALLAKRARAGKLDRQPRSCCWHKCSGTRGFNMFLRNTNVSLKNGQPHPNPPHVFRKSLAILCRGGESHMRWHMRDSVDDWGRLTGRGGCRVRRTMYQWSYTRARWLERACVATHDHTRSLETAPFGE